MAVCEIWDVKGRLDHPIDYAKNPEKTMNPKYTQEDLQALSDIIAYSTNDNKTEQQFFVSGINCDIATARQEMMIAKVQYSDQSEIVCYHGYQSFKEDEVTPSIAHEVGVKLAQEMWGERFQVVVSTHLNTKCLHNHFVVNSVSFVDGKHYHDNKANLKLLRSRSDKLCKVYDLSIIENPRGRKKAYAIYQAEKSGLPTRDNVARQAIDEAIKLSFTLKDFDKALSEMGYKCQFNPKRKYWTVMGTGWERPKRMYLLGDDYTNERIVERINENSYAVKLQPFAKAKKETKVYRLQGTFKPKRKIEGLRGLYFHYCYRLGILPKKRQVNYARLHHLLKDDLLKMDSITKEVRLLCRYRIDTEEQLFYYQETLEKEMLQLITRRKGLYSKTRSLARFGKSNENASKEVEKDKELIKEELSIISKRLGVIRKEVRLCEGIASRSGILSDKLKMIRSDEIKRKEVKSNEYRRRGSRTNR